MTSGLHPRFRLIKKLALIVSVVIVLYALVGFVIAPYFLKSNLISRLSDQLDRPVKIDEVRLNPFALSLFIKGFEINERDNTPLLGFGELYVNVQSSSLINRALTFDEIRLKLPYSVVKIHRDGTLNLTQLGSGSSP